MNEYQKRYLAHQKRKALSLTSNFGVKVKPYTEQEQKAFFNILNNRCSQRVFNNELITEKEKKQFLKAISTAPNSCGRKAIELKAVEDRQDKEILSGLLVGGVGWIHRGQIIFLLLADMDAYVNPAERDNMPYLDAGAVITTAYLIAEAMNMGCCFVNPHIREQNREFFKQRFQIKDNLLFCGAICLGKFDRKHKH